MQRLLISGYYKEQNRLLHETAKEFGTKGGKAMKYIDGVVRKYPEYTILDYGSGKGGFKKELMIIQRYPNKVYEYEPALDIDERQPCDIVVCRDVMEHIEPECVDAVIEDIRNLTKKLFFAVIATRKASKHLPDGTNTHRTVEKAGWWEEKISKYFLIEKKEIFDGEFRIWCKPI